MLLSQLVGYEKPVRLIFFIKQKTKIFTKNPFGHVVTFMLDKEQNQPKTQKYTLFIKKKVQSHSIVLN